MEDLDMGIVWELLDEERVSGPVQRLIDRKCLVEKVPTVKIYEHCVSERQMFVPTYFSRLVKYIEL
jgi:hypothetical protein